MRPTPTPVAVADVLPPTATWLPPADAAADLPVTGITLDSRTVQSGDIYAALPGHRTHGAHFAAAAVAAGARIVLTDPEGAALCSSLDVPVVVVPETRAALGTIAAEVYGRPAEGMHLLGVTGTNGKTTVATMVDAGLVTAGHVTGVIGTVGVQVAGVATSGARTTPEATDLHAVLAVMRESAVDTVVMEVSSIAVSEHRIDAVTYDVMAFTNLTQDHLDYHGTMEEYYRAKARLFQPDHARLGLVGIDDDWGRRLVAEAGIDVQTWSLLDPRADWHVVRDTGGTVVVGPGGERQSLTVALPGAFNVANAVCAYGMLRARGVAPEAAAAGIGRAIVPGRMQVVADLAGVRGVVDYAHSPDAIERVLRAARDVADGRLIVVLGAGGDRDSTKRPLMGETAARLADVLVVTDDNPRSEDPAAIRHAVREGALRVGPSERADLREEGDRRAAVTVAVGLAESGDMVLVLGKGHEQGQEAGGVVTPFDDAEVLRTALETRATS
jgi:UDP-N-acetylmuramoyl-L-alanyl-D-glutamate--2,6-diaminopimelate ligase